MSAALENAEERAARLARIDDEQQRIDAEQIALGARENPMRVVPRPAPTTVPDATHAALGLPPRAARRSRRRSRRARNVIQNAKPCTQPLGGERTQAEQAGADGWLEPVNILAELSARRFEAGDVPGVLGEYACAYAQATGIDQSLAITAAVSTAAER